MSLQDPSKKMSKSDDDQSGCLLLLDDANTITTKIKRAVTDSGSTIEASDDKPAITNLLQIYSGVSDRSVEEITRDYAGKDYGQFKSGLAEAVVAKLAPIKERHDQIMADPAHLLQVVEKGSQRASDIAEAKLAQIQHVIGLR